MAQPFFGRRDPEPVRSSTPATPAVGTAQPSAAAAAAAAAAVAAAAQAPIAATSGGGSKLTVGPNIKLKGVEITDCDTLLVEGTVEATMNSRVIEIAAQGTFRGTAEIDIAEIRGQFDGNLTVRQKLVIHSTGQVTGKVRYGKLVIEEGGQLCGDLQYVATGNPTLGPSTSPGLTSSVATAQGRVLPPASSKAGLHVAS